MHGRTPHQVGLPYPWGPNGHTTGDAADEPPHLPLDPDTRIQEAKAFAVDIRPGRRPRGPAAPGPVRRCRERAGIDERAGTGP